MIKCILPISLKLYMFVYTPLSLSLCQDLYVERLTKHVEKLSEQISLYEVQIIAQADQTKAAKEALSEVRNLCNRSCEPYTLKFDEFSYEF